MSKLPFFLAARFFRADGENKAKASRPAVRVSTISVAVSLAVMIITVGVVRGFQREIRATLSGFASHITLLNPLSFYNPEAAPIVIDEGVERDVRACLPPGSRFARFSTKSGILKTDDAYAAITLKGIGADYDTAFLKSRLAEGRLPAVGTERGKREILLSRLTADQLKLKRGDRIAAYFFERTVKMRRFDIVGIYDTHMPQFDRFFAVTDIAAVNTLNSGQGDQCGGIEIMLPDDGGIDAAQIALAGRFNGRTDRDGGAYLSQSLRENPRTASVSAWLELLDMNVLVILALMTVVAVVTMMCSLLILILERTRDIGLLKTLGARGGTVRSVFLWLSALILSRGMLWGNAVGLGILALQHFFGIVRLDPSVYYVDRAPVAFDVPLFLLINAGTQLVTLLALVLPSFIVGIIKPAKTMRYE